MDIYVAGTNMTVEQYQAALDLEEAAEAKQHGLSLDELRMAKRTGTSPEVYAAYKGVRTVRDAAAVNGTPEPASPFADLEREKERERIERGQPHGLSADEVEAADRTGLDVATYAGMKQVNSIDDWRALQEQTELERRALEQVRFEQAVEAAKGSG